MDNNAFNMQDEERERMQQFDLYRKLCVSILLRWWIVILVLIAGSAVSFAVLFQIQFLNSGERFEATTGLFFFPKEIRRYTPISLKQVMELLQRNALRKQIADRMNLSVHDRETLPNRMEISSERNRPNLISIVVKGATLEGTVQLANTVADICSEEYVEFRTRDLRSQLDTLLDRKAEVTRSLERCEKQQQELIGELTALAPSLELDRLRVVIGNGLARLTEINIQYANEEAKRKKLAAQLSTIDTVALRYSDRLKEMLDRQELLKRESLRLQQLYTGKNPRLLAALTEYEDSVKEYHDFLKEKQIGSHDPEALRSANSLLQELNLTTEKLETLKQNRDALNSEVAKNRDTVVQLTGILPKYNELATQRQSLLETLSNVEDGIGDLQLLIAVAPGEIQQVERVAGAFSAPAFGKKELALILAGTLAVSGLGVVLLVALSILFGKVSGREELTAFRSLQTVGVYPASEKLFHSPQAKEVLLHGIYYRLRSVLGEGHVLFAGPVEGAAEVSDIRQALEWNSAMAGIKFFRIFIVPAIDFKEPDGQEEELPLVAIRCVGQQGYFPVENPQALSPAEMEMLGNDVKVLQERYDLLVIFRNIPLQSNELFFRQMVEFSDCSLLYLGAGTTSRRLLRYAASLPRTCRKTVAVILTGVKRLTPADAR